VDALPEGAKELLQVGSLVEREFSYRLIKEVVQLPEQELLRYLSALKDAELLYERGLFPDSTFVFKHALTREVVGDSLLGKKKKQLHEEIGKALEEICRDNLEQHYGVLASHYMEGENFGQGAEYSRLAARRAEKAASMYDAVVHGRNRVACLEKLPHTEDVQRMQIDSRTILSMYMIQTGFYAEAREMVTPIFELARRTNYKKRICQIYTVLGTYYHCVEENYLESFKAFEEALKVAEEVKDILATTLGNYWFGYALGDDCQFERSAFHFEKAIEMNATFKNLWGIAAMKATFAFWCQYFNGKIDLNFQTAKEALQAAEESGDSYSKGLAYASSGVANFGKGYLEGAERQLLTAWRFCEKSYNSAWIKVLRFNLGEIYCEWGRFPEAGMHYGQSIATFDPNNPSWTFLMKAGLTKARVMNGEKDVDLRSTYDLAKNIRAKACEGWIARYIGEILLHIDDQHIAEAEDWIQKAIQADQRNGMMFELGRAYVLYAELFKRRGDRLQAQETLGRAIDILRDCGADGWVTKYEEELAGL